MRTYIITQNNSIFTQQETFFNEQELAELISESIYEEEYDDMLDECYPEVEITGFSYSPSVALYRVDRIAYDCGFNDYKDIAYNDVLCELNSLCDGEMYSAYGVTVQVKEFEAK